MFFWKKVTKNQFYAKASLQAIRKFHCPNHKEMFQNELSICNHSKRTFSFTSSYVKASMSVEAALSFSFYLFFMANIFSLIFLFQQYGNDLKTLQQRGKETAIYAYATDGSFHHEDVIVLKKSRNVKPLFSILPVPECKLLSQCVVKPWTGYPVEGLGIRKQEEEIVYMTKYGQVYHRSRDCSYLSLSLYVVAYEEVKYRQNQNGDRYDACEICGNHGFTSVAFLTKQGNRYHSQIHCPGLTRTIECIPLSQIPGVPACKKCG